MSSSSKEGLSLTPSYFQDGDNGEEHDDQMEDEEEIMLLPSNTNDASGDADPLLLSDPLEDPSLSLPSANEIFNSKAIDSESSLIAALLRTAPLRENGKESSSSAMINKLLQPPDNSGKDSDSDSDVILVEKDEEIIELSDDEASECADLLNTLCLPEDIINILEEASNKVSLKLGELIKNSNEARDIVVEVPTITWSLPWKVISGLFKNPSLASRAKRSTVSSTSHPMYYSPTNKRKLKEDCNLKRKISKVEGIQFKGEVKDTIVNFKQEKDTNGLDENGRILSVIHFDPNRPPEFCEVSRSGRLIKKPSRLKDDVTFFRRSNQWRRKNISSSVKRKSDDIDADESVTTSSSFSEQEPAPSEMSTVRDMSDVSLENSIDSESCDRWMLGLNSDTDSEYIDIVNFSAYDAIRLNQNNEKETTRRSSNRKNDSQSPELETTLTDRFKCTDDRNSTHNLREQKRRHELKMLFCHLLKEIISVREDFTTNKNISKNQMLKEAVNTIEYLEFTSKSLKETIGRLKLNHKTLAKKLTFLKNKKSC